MSAGKTSVPDTAFLTYMSAKDSRSNDRMRQAYGKTEGRYVQHIELSAGNHYAINDWNPVQAPHQVCILLV